MADLTPGLDPANFILDNLTPRLPGLRALGGVVRRVWGPDMPLCGAGAGRLGVTASACLRCDLTSGVRSGPAVTPP